MISRSRTCPAFLLSTVAALVLVACSRTSDAPPPTTSKGAAAPVAIQVKKFEPLPSIDASRKVVLDVQCNVEAIGGKLVASFNSEDARRNAPLAIEGWAYGPASGAGGARNYALLVESGKNWNESSYGAESSKAVSRPDVNAYLKLESPGDLGIAVLASLEAVPPGLYEVLFRLDRGDTVYVCRSGRNLKVVD